MRATITPLKRIRIYVASPRYFVDLITAKKILGVEKRNA
jgi:hypothetical protein